MKLESILNQRSEEIWAASRLPVQAPGDDTEQLEVEVWVEGSTGLVRMCSVVPAGADLAGFCDGFLSAMSSPMGDMEPYRPGKLLVDRKELAKAIRPLAAEHGVEVEVRSAVADDLRELAEKIEGDLAEEYAFQYLAEGDVKPETVTAFFEQAHRYLTLAPWELEVESLTFEVSGLTPQPLVASVAGEDEPGLALYPSLEAARAYATFDGEDLDALEPSTAMTMLEPALASAEFRGEMEAHGWTAHMLGLPVLTAQTRLERPNATESELLEMTAVLEALTYYLGEGDEPSMAFELSTGAIVKVTPTEDVFAQIPTFENADEAVVGLDRLWDEGEAELAAAAASQYLEDEGDFDPRVIYRFALYLTAMEAYEDLDEVWKSFATLPSPELHYVGAFLAHGLEHSSTASKRLKKAVKQDPQVGHRLLALDPEDDFSRLWVAPWAEASGLRLELEELLAAAAAPGKSSSKSSPKLSGKGKGKGKKKH